jgi:hypothetical protein
VEQKLSTKENINSLIEFRQAIYQNGMLARRDALFDLLDALVIEGKVSSFAYLSQSEQFRRKWPSLYAAVEDGQLDSPWLRQYLGRQVPGQGIQVFALDGTSWPRPRARTMADRQYVYQASSAVNGGTVTIGYPYSLLEWSVESHSSWSLAVDVRRVSSAQTAQEVGAVQVRCLADVRKELEGALDLVVCDGKYGNTAFLRAVQGLRCGIIARLRRDRVLRREPPPRSGKRGRPPRHGKRFAFKDPNSWGVPNETVCLEDPYWGTVRLERWEHLHGQGGADVPFTVLRASVHLERSQPPAALWLASLAPTAIPEGLVLTAETLWRAYEHRWPVEPGIHFRKESLGWTLPHFQSAEAGDRWSELTALAGWMIFLARSIVSDLPLPWQTFQSHLTPQRVQQSLLPIFALIGSPARPPKSRGKSPGWKKGRQRARKLRFPVVKKQPEKAVAA